MVSVDGTEQKMRFLDFGSEKNEILLFVSSDNVNDETLMQIAESFEST